MERFIVIVLGAMVLALFIAQIEGITEEELEADPTMCRAIANFKEWKKEEITLNSDGNIIQLQFGQTENYLLLAFSNLDCTEYYRIYIYNYRAVIDFRTATRQNDISESRYPENKLNLTDLNLIDVQLKFGSELLIKVLLPNGVVLLAADPTPINIKIAWHYLKDSKWFMECANAQVQSTMSIIDNMLNVTTDEPSRFPSSTSEEYTNDTGEHDAVESMEMEQTSKANRLHLPNMISLLINCIKLISNLSVYFIVLSSPV